MTLTNVINKKQLRTKVSLFAIGIPFIASNSFSHMLPDAMSHAVGLFAWCMIFHFVPPRWSNRTFAQDLGLSAGLSFVIYVLASLINRI